MRCREDRFPTGVRVNNRSHKKIPQTLFHRPFTENYLETGNWLNTKGAFCALVCLR